MKDFKLGWTHDCCRSSFENRCRGEQLRAWLEQAEFRADSTGRFLQVSLKLPFSLKSYLALRRISLRAFYENDYLTLTSARPKCHALVPNVWKAGANQSVSAFLKLPKSLNIRMGKVVEEFPFPAFSFLEFLSSLEAVLPGHFSPLMISIGGLRFQAGQPSLVNLSATAVPILPSTRPRPSQMPQVFKTLMQDLRSARREFHGSRAEVAFDRAESQSMDIPDQIRLVALKKVYRKTKIRFTSAERLARATMTLVDRFCQGDSLLESLSSPELAAYRLLKDLEIVPDEWKKNQPRRKRSVPRPYAVVPPQLYHGAYGLNEPPPNKIDDLSVSALRILTCVLVHCGRRACCLLAIALKDFHLAYDPIQNKTWTDLNIRFTKSKNETEMRLPLSALWPEYELNHLQAFLDKTSDLFPNTTLLELLEPRGISKENPDRVPQILRKRFPQVPNLLGTSSLHLPRITWATFWPVRVWCAFNPEYLQHPCLADVRQHVWFSDEMLSKIRNLLQDEIIDSLEIARRIMGHSNTFEFVADYCRAWPILMQLQADSRNL